MDLNNQVQPMVHMARMAQLPAQPPFNPQGCRPFAAAGYVQNQVRTRQFHQLGVEIVTITDVIPTAIFNGACGQR